ncbi:uncharacterized protein Ppcs isoform X3 [Periplaneta americana]|uniref:uncharacterized protein Ppcs isoform X3 n=1 Tax=Periplaneta americana TaxID=6978 RepID=UPI0037E82BE6
MSSRWEEFYASLAIPTDFEENKNKIKDFCEHVSSQQKIVLVTSGGTTVPLEHNTVRFVDNFSAGTRGSASAEYFLEKGYVVIFVHRLKSLEPYVRHFMGQKFLDMLEIHNDEAETSVVVKSDHVNSVLPILTKYKSTMEARHLLCIPFTTLTEYMWLLRAACECLAPFGARAVLYLAAAVSDFYIPSSQMMVIANILHTRKYRVVLVMATTCSEIVLDPEEIEAGIEIESKIVSELTKRHESFIAESV